MTLTLGVDDIKIVMPITYKLVKWAIVFMHGKPLQPILTFAC